MLKRHTSESHISLEEGSLEASEYSEEHDKACRWAKADRNLMVLRFLACLEPGNGDWQIGVSASDFFNNTDRARTE